MSFNTVIHFVLTVLYPGLLVMFLFGLTILIHELGHFLVAKRRGMVIERFSIGFGPRVWGVTKDGIDYRVSLLPFGGYVALPQMSPMEAVEGKTESSSEDLPPASPSSKTLVALAGPVMNFLFAVVLACVVWKVGLAVPVNPSTVGWIEPNSREEQLGILAGDRIVQVNDRQVQTWMDVQRAVAVSREPSVNVAIEHAGQRKEFLLETELNPSFGLKTINLYPQGRPYAMDILPDSPAQKAGILRGDKFLSVEGVPVSTEQQLRELIGKQAEKPTVVKVVRDGSIVTIHVVPRLDDKEKVGRMGVMLADELDYQTVKPGPTPMKQFRDIFGLMGDTVYALIHSKQTGIGARSLSGPVGIAGGWWYEIVHGGITRGLWYAVLLNINLALINLLPLPLLDGGHIVLSGLEAVRRKPLNARLLQATSMTFAVVLITFMLYVTFFDIQRLTFGWFRPGGASSTNQPAATPSTHPQ
jgi:regulator of sigma E protease